MALETKIPPKKRILNLLFVMFFGVLFGFAVVGFFLYRYNPTGQYAVRHVLLAPNTLTHLWYSDQNPKTGGQSRFVFADIEIEQYSDQERKWVQRPLSLSEYDKLYGLISQDISLENVEEIEKNFQIIRPLKIQILVQTESDAKWQAVREVFQEIQIIKESGYYRIQLHEDDPGINWVYFHNPRIAEFLNQFREGS